MKLRIDQQLSQFPFAQKPFEVDIYLVDDHDHLRLGVEDIQLSVSLQLNDEPVAPINQPKLLDIIENTGIMKSGLAKVKVKFLDASASYDRKKFILVFHANSTSLKIQPVHSIPMYCVRFKLRVEEENKVPYIW